MGYYGGRDLSQAQDTWDLAYILHSLRVYIYIYIYTTVKVVGATQGVAGIAIDGSTPHVN